MLKRLFFVFALLFPFITFAQQTEYFDTNWQTCNPRIAAYTRQYTPDDDGYKVLTTTTDGKQLMTGHITSFKKGYAFHRNGPFTYYDKDGHKTQSGNYEDGMPVGKWYYYYQGNDSVEYETTYEDGTIVSEKRIESGTGRPYGESIYKEGKAIKSFSYEYYTSGQLKKTTILDYLHKEGNPKSTAYMQSEGTTTSVCYDEQGKEIVCDTTHSQAGDTTLKYLEALPQAPYPISQYLSENIVYPPYSQKKNIQGRVSIAFTVTKEGSIARVRLCIGVSPDIDEEALRVVSLMPKWKPGMQNGKAVNVMYTQPIYFKLQ